MSLRPSTLVLDDGELGDVRQALEQIGVEYTYLRGGACEGLDVRLPEHLLVASVRHALRLPAAPGAGADASDSARLVRIAVASEDSNALRQQLRRAGFDYLVRRPLHPGALRLLLLRSLYRGPERRVAVRHPIGGPVLYRTGLWRKPATLLEIALRGCRLQTSEPVEPDERVHVVLPKDFTGASALSLEGWALRCDPSPRKSGGFEVAVAFEGLRSSRERRLRQVLKRKIFGLDVHDAQGSAGDAAPAQPLDRRESRRAAFQGEVRALRDRAERALVGRNLSRGGMLVEQNLELRVGEETKLAIFGREDEEPILVRARVVREDESGVALEFVDVAAGDPERLEALVAGLPAVERLADGEAGAMGTVVAEILGNDRA